VSGTSRRVPGWTPAWLARRGGRAALATLTAALAGCTACGPAALPATAHAAAHRPSGAATPARAIPVGAHASRTPRPREVAIAAAGAPLAAPPPLRPFAGPAGPGARAVAWRPAGRPVRGVAAVYETRLVPPGGDQPAGIAWMDTRLLAARLYSGSVSRGGGPYRYTAPVRPAAATSLVAAFNGGFKMRDAGGGYYAAGRAVVPLRRGAASLVISAGGNVTVGAWGRDVTMSPRVVSVRQNLVPLVAGGRPTAQAASPHWRIWGDTCGAASCAATVPGVEHQWRSGVGVTSAGALVYVAGPALDPLQLAQLLARAGVVRGMELDINPDWPVFASYDPPGGRGPASPGNGTRLLGTVQGPATFFEPSWARDFITMSARG
jgi:hypothetical protein